MSVSQSTLPALHRFTVKALINRSMKSLRSILLIDDDDVFIFLTTKMLQSTGKVSDITVSHSVTEGIECLENHLVNGSMPDIIFLDLNMPGMDGWDFLQYYQSLLSQMKRLPLLYVVSSSIAGNDTQRAMKIKGVAGYIAKPVDAAAISKIINRLNRM
jgi:CheY-like chemotaxis protein